MRILRPLSGRQQCIGGGALTCRVRARYARETMTSAVVPLPRIRRWTRVEYERLIELGIFRAGERLELLDGQLVVREPQGSRHAGTIRRVLAALRRALGEAWQVDSQLPIALDDDSEPEPDISVVAHDPGAYLDAHPSRAVLIVDQCVCSQVTSPRTGCMNCLPSGVSAYSTRGGTSA